MSLGDEIATENAERLRVARSAPTGFEPGIRYDPSTGRPSEFTTPPVDRDVQHTPGAWDDLVQSLGLTLPPGYEARLVEARFDPHAWTRTTEYTLVGDAQQRTPATTRPAWRYRFAIVPRSGIPADLTELVQVARTNRPTGRPGKRPSHGLRVVVASDAQVGKVGSDGGTTDLLNRVENLLGQLDEVMRDEPCDEAITADPGDLAEGFENVPSQPHTNDLSHPEQLRVARLLLTEIVTTVAARHKTNRVLTVPSNHTQWRRGKAILGKPTDDYGIDIHRAVAEALKRDRKYRDVTFVVPEPWRESLAVQARGAVLGLVHGHQAKPGKAWDWWKGQIAGDLPVAAANILIGGHYHSWLTQPHGSLDGRPRWFFQADPLDNGSDWWANLTGDQSEPSLMTFTIDDAGRWHNLRRITT